MDRGGNGGLRRFDCSLTKALRTDSARDCERLRSFVEVVTK